MVHPMAVMVELIPHDDQILHHLEDLITDERDAETA
jgi:hypothetical protein